MIFVFEQRTAYGISAGLVGSEVCVSDRAFGAAGGFGELVDTHEARNAIEGLVAENKRITFVWAVEASAMPPSAVKLLLTLFLTATESVSYTPPTPPTTSPL